MGKTVERVLFFNKKRLKRKRVAAYATTYPWKDPVALVFNDNGVEEWLQPNRVLEEYKDVLLGSFFVCGLGEEEFQSLPDDLIPKFTERFRWPEMFKRAEDGRLMCIRNTDCGPEVRPIWD